MQTPHLRFRAALDEFGRRLDAIPGDAWEQPTPCAAWTVRDLVDHVVDETCWARSVLVPTPADDNDADDAGGPEDPVARWHDAASALSPALGSSEVLDRTIDLPSRRVPARELLPELTVDHLVHAWDLASATGGDTHLDRDLVTACATWFDKHEDEWREAGQIGPALAVPADADDQRSLLARFGRQEHAPDDPGGLS